MADDTLDLGLASFGDPPESVARTVRDMEKIALRRAANARVATERDTERYLVIVYPERRSAASTSMAWLTRRQSVSPSAAARASTRRMSARDRCGLAAL